MLIVSFQVAEARREAEEKRDAKYAKMERQREEIRQGIREKVRKALLLSHSQLINFCQNNEINRSLGKNRELTNRERERASLSKTPVCLFVSRNELNMQYLFAI